jgi:hypothetical protein
VLGPAHGAAGCARVVACAPGRRGATMIYCLL